jgi:molybdate transport system ATP-binding protein
MIEIAVTATRGDFTLDATMTGSGGVTALFGPSGAGKSTVIAMIAGLITPQQGRITLNGRVLFDGAQRINVPPHRRRIGVVFQEDRLFPHLNVKQNLLYGRWFNKDRSANLSEIIDLLNLGALLDRRPLSLSGGEKQRVSLGRALLTAPELLLLDEPLSNLDPLRRAEVLPYLERLRDHKNIPMVYVSHTVEEVVRLTNHVVVLDRGRIIADGTTEAVLNNAALWPVFGEQDAGSILTARIAGHDPDGGLTHLSLGDEKMVIPLITGAVGSNVHLRVLARDVAIATAKPSHISIRNILSGTVIAITPGTATTPVHNSTEITIAIGGAILTARITRASVQDLNLAVGQQAYALLKAVAMDRPSLNK